ncbi:MAG: hypothetical protein D6750_02535, partial [Bacteroidetes bacterium]
MPLTFRVLGVAFTLALLWAQEKPEPETEENPAETPYSIQEEPPLPAPYKESRPLGIRHQFYNEVAYNHWLNVPDTLRGSVEGLGSIKLNFSWLPNLRLGPLYVGTGLGLTIRETRFEEPVVLYRTGEALSYTIDSLPASVRAKSKLQLGYLRIPLELGLLHKRFQLAIFGYGEYLLWAKHKRKYREGDDLARSVSYGNRTFRTTPFQYGVGARLGYRGIGI